MKREFGKPQKPTHLLILAMLIVSCIVLTCSFALAYGLALLLSRAIGPFPPLLFHILASFLSVGILLAGFALISHTRMLKNRNFHEIGQRVLDALEQVSRGDFSVRLNPDEGGPFTEVMTSFNKMVEDLGSLDAQRQDFVASVSHEIQSPLTSISGFAALLRDESLTAEERSHYLDIIENESGRLSSLGDKLLKLATLEEGGLGEVECVCLAEQLQSSILMLEPQWLDKGIQIELDLADISLQANPDLLKQVWVNLLQNAIKFVEQNGRIRVTTRTEKGTALIEIADNGIGIADSDLPHIFERFYKADKARDRTLGGNGLGLALVKRIVELHGGQVWATSKPDCETVFSLSLPCVYTKAT
jgi:signal transduction histidine kinase